ncbi:MAG: hypothetical protein WD603_03340 [Patescibacteria group bacterium]
MSEEHAFELAMKHPDLLGQYGMVLPEHAEREAELFLWVRDPESESGAVQVVPIEFAGFGKADGWETLTVSYYGPDGAETVTLPFDTFGHLVDVRQPVPPQIGFVGSGRGVDGSPAYDALFDVVHPGGSPNLEHLAVTEPE